LHLTSSANIGRIRLTSKLYIVLKTQVWKLFKLLDIYNKRHPTQSSPDNNKKKSQLQFKSFDNVDWICWQRCNHLQYRYRGYGGGGGGGSNVNRSFRKTTTSKNDCGRKKGEKMREKRLSNAFDLREWIYIHLSNPSTVHHHRICTSSHDPSAKREMVCVIKGNGYAHIHTKCIFFMRMWKHSPAMPSTLVYPRSVYNIIGTKQSFIFRHWHVNQWECIVLFR